MFTMHTPNNMTFNYYENNTSVCPIITLSFTRVYTSITSIYTTKIVPILPLLCNIIVLSIFVFIELVADARLIACPTLT